MKFVNPANEQIAALLKRACTIAVVGLSDDPSRPSYDVARAMQRYGYRIIPVNPSLTQWEGSTAFPNLEAAVAALQPGASIDIVDVFRLPKHVDAIVTSCLQLQLPALWLQLGVIDATAALRAQAAGMIVVMDKCIKVERMRLG